MNWYIYLTLTLGVVYLLTESLVFAPYRQLMASSSAVLRVLAYCRACTGFWVGFAFHRLLPVTFVGDADIHPQRAVLSGFTIMLLGYAWSAVVENHAFMTEVLGPELEKQRRAPPAGPLSDEEPS